MDALNYIWLSNDKYYDPKEFASKSPIPTEYLDNAVRTARDNPDVQVNIWAEFGKVDKRYFDDFVIKPQNLTFRNLNDVEGYREDPLFHDANADIWKKCDLVRLYVLDHVISKENAANAYFSDFDIKSPKFSSAPVQDKLKHTGYVFSYCDRDKNGHGYIENGWFGINGAYERENNLLKKEFIPSTKSGYAWGNKNGWMAFCKCAGKICNLSGKITTELLKDYAIDVGGIESTGGEVTLDREGTLLPSYPQFPRRQSSPLASQNTALVATP